MRDRDPRDVPGTGRKPPNQDTLWTQQSQPGLGWKGFNPISSTPPGARTPPSGLGHFQGHPQLGFYLEIIQKIHDQEYFCSQMGNCESEKLELLLPDLGTCWRQFQSQGSEWEFKWICHIAGDAPAGQRRVQGGLSSPHPKSLIWLRVSTKG